MTCFISTINFVYSQIDLKIGESRIENKSNLTVYKLELTDRKSEYLIISVKPSDNYESYSDPDVFVSKVITSIYI